MSESMGTTEDIRYTLFRLSYFFRSIYCRVHIFRNAAHEMIDLFCQLIFLASLLAIRNVFAP